MKANSFDGVAALIGPGIIASLGLLLIFGNPVSQAALCDGEGNCLRAWVEALGGWVALPVAVISVAFLSTQIKQASNQHKKSVLLQTMREVTHARLMRRHNARTLKHLDALAAFARDNDDVAFQDRLDYMALLGPATFSASIHAYFEDEFGVETNISASDVEAILVDLPALRSGVVASSYLGSPLAAKMADIRSQANATNKAAISYLKAIRELSADDN